MFQNLLIMADATSILSMPVFGPLPFQLRVSATLLENVASIMFLRTSFSVAPPSLVIALPIEGLRHLVGKCGFHYLLEDVLLSRSSIALPIEGLHHLVGKCGFHNIFLRTSFSVAPPRLARYRTYVYTEWNKQFEFNSYNYDPHEVKLFSIVWTNSTGYLRKGRMISSCLPFIQLFITSTGLLVFNNVRFCWKKPFRLPATDLLPSGTQLTCLRDHGWMLKSLFKPGLI